MDIIAFMFLAALGVTCWIVGALKQHSPIWVKAGVWPACLWLGVYFLMMLARSEPELWAGKAEAGPTTVLIIAFGVYAAIAKREPHKRPNDGGHRSA